MTCLPSRPSQSTPDPQIHRFFYYKFIFFFVSLLSMAVEEESCCVSYSPVEAPVFWSRRREARMSGQALNILTGCSSHTAAGRSRCRKYTWGLWRNPWSSCETRTSCCHGTLGTGWRRSRRRSGTSGDAEPSKETQRGSIHTVVFYLPKDLIIWEKPARFQFGRRIW